MHSRIGNAVNREASSPSKVIPFSSQCVAAAPVQDHVCVTYGLRGKAPAGVVLTHHGVFLGWFVSLFVFI